MRSFALIARTVPPLAQSVGGVTGLWLWGGVLIVVAVGALFAILAIKRRLMDKGDNESTGWTLQDIKALHASGEISDDEFRTLRDQVIGSVGGVPGPRDRDLN